MATRQARYPNTYARLVYAVGSIVVPAVVVLGSPLLGLQRFWGLGGVIGTAFFGEVCVLALLSYTLFTSVEIAPGRVILRGLLYKRTILASEIERIELEPPVHTLSLDWRFGKPWSSLIIYRRGKPYVNCNAMPDGLKRRIAQALDPTRFPPLPGN